MVAEGNAGFSRFCVLVYSEQQYTKGHSVWLPIAKNDWSTGCSSHMQEIPQISFRNYDVGPLCYFSFPSTADCSMPSVLLSVNCYPTPVSLTFSHPVSFIFVHFISCYLYTTTTDTRNEFNFCITALPTQSRRQNRHQENALL